MTIQLDQYYPSDAPELNILGAVQTRARWRHEGVGPAYIKIGGRVLYRGSDVVAWLEARRINTAAEGTE